MPAAAVQQFLNVRILRISDGDTLVIETADKSRMMVRLSGIDAPESKQPFGIESRHRLAQLLTGREINLDCLKTDRYARQVCRVFADNEDVSLLMLNAGAAWWFRRYAHEQSVAERRDYAAAENDARTHSVGLWAAAAPVPPWDWRKNAKYGPPCRAAPNAGAGCGQRQRSF